MSQKRHQEDGKARSEGNNSEDKRRRKVPSLRNVVLEVMRVRNVQHVLEPLIRRVVKEEVDLALRKYLTSMKRNCGKEIHLSESRSLQLQFINSLSLPVFTGTRIEGEDSSTLKVALVDAITGHVVCSGSESSARVEIAVLEGDFDGEEGDNWTLEEFKNNIVREREGKKPLLTGDAFFNLKEGIGLVGEISFTDNSSWTRSRKFRLGARVVDNCDGIRVREAKTESFIVRDHRGELYKKHHPPFLLDEVWRLEKIGKDGAFHKRLCREKIFTVKDFLTLLFLDPTRLRTILGTGMSAKMWEVTVDHARTCILDKKLYLYCPTGSQQKTGVVFNVVGQVTGLLSECQYVHIDKLSETEKADAHNLVISAFKHWEEVVSFDDEASLMDDSSCLSSVLYPSNSPMTESSDGSKILSSQKIGRFDYLQPSVSSPDIMPSIYSIGSVSSMDEFGLPDIENMDPTYDQPFSFPGQVTNSLIYDTESISQAFCEDEPLPYFNGDCALQSQKSSLESKVDLHSGFLLAPSAYVKAQRRWKMIFCVLRWFSIRRIVAKKNPC
uniref:Calmodulin-binding protein 60 A n=1 Tax=Davidia involucrata TaxID=16924 RepID=A0A5B7ACG9_DAVIN